MWTFLHFFLRNLVCLYWWLQQMCGISHYRELFLICTALSTVHILQTDSSLSVLTEVDLPEKAQCLWPDDKDMYSSIWQPWAFSIYINSQIQKVILIPLPLQLLAHQQVTGAKLQEPLCSPLPTTPKGHDWLQLALIDSLAKISKDKLSSADLQMLLPDTLQQ